MSDNPMTPAERQAARDILGDKFDQMVHEGRLIEAQVLYDILRVWKMDNEEIIEIADRLIELAAMGGDASGSTNA